MKTDDGHVVVVGDRLRSEWGYDVVVVFDEGELVGRLVCESGHPCAEMDYALNDGRGHTFVAALAAGKE